MKLKRPALMLIAALGIGTMTAQADVNGVLASLQATVAASDYGRRHPDGVSNMVFDYQNVAISVQEQQTGDIPLILYLAIEERLAEDGIGPGLMHDLLAAIVDRSAQLKGSVNGFTVEDFIITLRGVREFIRSSYDKETAVKSILAESHMRHAANWVRNFSDAKKALSTPPSPTPVPTPKMTDEQIRKKNEAALAAMKH